MMTSDDHSILPPDFERLAFKVRIAEWARPRKVALIDGTIYFQATTCYPCSTCRQREGTLDSGLRNSHTSDFEKKIIDEGLFYIRRNFEGDPLRRGEVVDVLKNAFQVKMIIVGSREDQDLIWAARRMKRIGCPSQYQRHLLQIISEGD